MGVFVALPKRRVEVDKFRKDCHWPECLLRTERLVLRDILQERSLHGRSLAPAAAQDLRPASRSRRNPGLQPSSRLGVDEGTQKGLLVPGISGLELSRGCDELLAEPLIEGLVHQNSLDADAAL